ncbi:Kelch-type beta propeller [Neofusicoccum parvum]|uniref:Kelch-type beta propeller n=1 Tax=Neofusicoccum parvum TaxID=310453 RepID=A0ACB5RRT4_9PEZI|nr:Kelch-type beta propeller [Neofusicoccum parvum]
MAATKVTGTWKRLLDSDTLRRSSQVVASFGDQLFLFGGEIQPRQPVDNHVHLISLDGSDAAAGQASASTLKADHTSPSPRVGSASASLNNHVYLFSGRGGEAMAPVEERGSLWAYDRNSSKWSTIAPLNANAPYPPARSYHCLASDGKDNIFVHAGCPEKGRLSDLWSFNIATKEWAELASAPDPPRGGTSVVYARERLYRMNGFDGTTEQGGSLDVFDHASNSWSSIKYAPDGKEGPEARSVGALLYVHIAGRPSLVTLFGERDPSALGHQGAGKMLGDVWVFDIESAKWAKAETVGGAGADKKISALSAQEQPRARGWFAACVKEVDQPASILVHGGLGESNERLGDVWQLQFSAPDSFKTAPDSLTLAPARAWACNWLAVTAAATLIHAKRCETPIYYGKNSSPEDPTLEALCEDDSIATVILGYVHGFKTTNGFPIVDFGSSCQEKHAEDDRYAPGLASCPQLGRQVKTCQTRGKKVFLSIGGPQSQSSIAFVDAADARRAAVMLWSLFGQGDPHGPDMRPLGEAAVDGFDFAPSPSIRAFASTLRTLSDMRKNYKPSHLSTTPACANADDDDPDAVRELLRDLIDVGFSPATPSATSEMCEVGRMKDSRFCKDAEMQSGCAGPYRRLEKGKSLDEVWAAGS